MDSLRYSSETPSLRSCGLRAALDVASGKWKPLILWHLLEGSMRPADLRRRIEGVSEKVFLQQLKELEISGIIDRAQLSQRPLIVAYSITPLGASLAPILRAMSEWGFKNLVGMEKSSVASGAGKD